MDKVFCSDITRGKTQQNIDLKDLCKVDPAQPINNKNTIKANFNNTISQLCDFQPRSDKYYVQKKKSKLKVRTVRDIRNTFEKDVLTDLPNYLDRQQNLLLRKIRDGSSKNDNTKVIAKNILNGEEPITRSSWQMLMNINPEEHLHTLQYIMYNGKPIQINGSKGGRTKFIYNLDAGKVKKALKSSSEKKFKPCYKKKYLLRNSLSVNFKPGPLTRKKMLDNSYQKFNVGKIELVNLPNAGLEIQPAHGSTLDTTITNLINNLRDVNGFISDKWAEFAVSVLGTKTSSIVYQSNESPVCFNLSYKCDQRRILMRRDQDRESEQCKRDTTKLLKIMPTDEFDVIPEVRVMMNKIIDAVEIGLNQDNMYTGEDESREEVEKDSLNSTNYIKDNKNKRKYGELDRLDVTVIRLPEKVPNTNTSVCRKSFCILGCICDSLQSSIPLKNHCGRISCMFKCKCDLSKYIPDYDGECRDLLPGLINLKKEMNNKLSKEEQKFHQTVIVTGNQSILLKSERRNWKSSKKYADFYRNMSLKSETKIDPILSITITKLNCENIEPWCMVHNLYKCFCKCKFTDTMAKEKILNETEKVVVQIQDKDLYSVENSLDDRKGQIEKSKPRLRRENYPPSNETIIILDDDNSCSSDSVQLRSRTRSRRETRVEKDIDDIQFDSHMCARVKPYDGRKYTPGYYQNANFKIQDMEVNDIYLRNRLHELMNNSIQHETDTTPETTQIIDTEEMLQEKSIELENDEIDSIPVTIIDSSSKVVDSNLESSNLEMIETSDKRISNKPKLVAWLESSYQQYKKRLNLGIIKNTLEPPKKGKVCLYPWDFILSRYSERKNLFLISKIEPFRIFMAVDNKNPLFKNCINIDEIRFADLYKYPVTVKNLLTNTSGLKDNFCILFGLAHCWELIGSVMKINESKDISSDYNAITDTLSEQAITDISSMITEGVDEASLEESVSDGSSFSNSKENVLELLSPSKSTVSDSSKWFVMTVENDFTEIQFYNKGFFVKYESIVKAINVARMSGKTVRLSSQKCADKCNNPQFGIYAIPNTKEYCVFVGPYEHNESLGIETVKTITRGRKQRRTRGVWINTNKVDNLKVIDNPLSFMPSEDIQMNEMLPIENILTENCDNPSLPQISQPVLRKDKNNTIKPIKIRKSDGFYRIASRSLLKVTSKNYPENVGTTNVSSQPHSIPLANKADSPLILGQPIHTLPIIIAPDTPLENESTLNDIPVIIMDSHKTSDQSLSTNCDRKLNKPVAEVAPQIKIAAVYSEATKISTDNKKTERMVILKPEEINKRLLDKNMPIPHLLSTSSTSENDAMDIEDFLESSTICTAPDSLTLIISDDEEESPIKNVLIKCTNVQNLGCIEGRMNKEGEISFKFPGFKYSDYYRKTLAFVKIFQVLSRKIYVPDNVTLEWDIVESNIKNVRMLQKEELGADIVSISKCYYISLKII
ncbi:unnamed protein product [Diatraea saccharalis]|uniref:MGA conserved domain-containing protein n=1 Tax=Diatraea saccharalis TaxID=40085 RepID=A0A9P0CC07_9NEOP|nr:unnamed protein product [Diatraea saccharalis]